MPKAYNFFFHKNSQSAVSEMKRKQHSRVLPSALQSVPLLLEACVKVLVSVGHVLVQGKAK